MDREGDRDYAWRMRNSTGNFPVESAQEIVRQMDEEKKVFRKVPGLNACLLKLTFPSGDYAK